ncbi:hypothetical protein EB796_019757 [Bugula neritina]|uniref:Uncharacterized protein n=1 Tax=Bugula neritina TaxID=10212 RepID=A0A7J7J861_BUGNE|nr:hypothetical protein EB796_019757 [Bugula neritina]
MSKLTRKGFKHTPWKSTHLLATVTLILLDSVNIKGQTKEKSLISGKKGASVSDSKRLTIHISSDSYDIVVPSVALLSDDHLSSKAADFLKFTLHESILFAYYNLYATNLIHFMRHYIETLLTHNSVEYM